MENVKIMTDCLLNPEIHDKITAPIHGHFFDCSTVAIHKRKLKFLTKLPHSKNTKCTLFEKHIIDEMDNVSLVNVSFFLYYFLYLPCTGEQR